MNGSIRFPHLGIALSHVPKSFSIGGFEIACYGLVLAVAILTGIFLVIFVARTTGQNGDDYFDISIIAVIAAIVGARLYYVIFSWDYYSHHLLEIFNLRRGGLAIYGGLALGCLTLFIACRIRKMSIPRVLDTAVVGVVWGQMVGRWGNFFNREAFGGYTDNLFAMQLPVSDVRETEITGKMLENLQTIDGVEYVQVHPTFLYESLWNLGVFLILLLLTYKMKNRRPGVVVLSYLLLYGTGRFWIESLRTDQLILFGTGLPVSQVLSGILVVFSAVMLIILAKKSRGKKEKKS